MHTNAGRLNLLLKCVTNTFYPVSLRLKHTTCSVQVLPEHAAITDQLYQACLWFQHCQGERSHSVPPQFRLLCKCTIMLHIFSVEIRLLFCTCSTVTVKTFSSGCQINHLTIKFTNSISVRTAATGDSPDCYYFYTVYTAYTSWLAGWLQQHAGLLPACWAATVT